MRQGEGGLAAKDFMTLHTKMVGYISEMRDESESRDETYFWNFSGAAQDCRDAALTLGQVLVVDKLATAFAFDPDQA